MNFLKTKNVSKKNSFTQKIPENILVIQDFFLFMTGIASFTQPLLKRSPKIFRNFKILFSGNTSKKPFHFQNNF